MSMCRLRLCGVYIYHGRLKVTYDTVGVVNGCCLSFIIYDTPCGKLHSSLYQINTVA